MVSGVAPDELERLVACGLDQPGQRRGLPDAVTVADERDPRELTRILDHGSRRPHVAPHDPLKALGELPVELSEVRRAVGVCGLFERPHRPPSGPMKLIETNLRRSTVAHLGWIN